MKRVMAIAVIFFSVFLSLQSCSMPPSLGEKLVTVSADDVYVIFTGSMPYKNGLMAQDGDYNHGRAIFDRAKIERICKVISDIHVVEYISPEGNETDWPPLDGGRYSVRAEKNDGTLVAEFDTTEEFVSVPKGIGENRAYYSLTSKDSFNKLKNVLDFENPIVADVPTTQLIHLNAGDYTEISYQNGYSGFNSDLSNEEAKAVINKLNNFESAYMKEQTDDTVGYTNAFMLHTSEGGSFSIDVDSSGYILLPKHIIDSSEMNKEVQVLLYSPDEDYFNRNWNQEEPLLPIE